MALRLTDEQVAYIRMLFARGWTIGELAKRYRKASSSIERIVKWLSHRGNKK
jgi:Mor family transcriptional regulator